MVRINKPVHKIAPAAADTAAFAAPLVFNDHRDVEPCHGAGITGDGPIRAHDFDFLKRGRQGCADLYDAGIKSAGKGVNLGQRVYFCRKRDPVERVVIRVELFVGPCGCIGQYATAFANGQAGGFNTARYGSLRDFRTMCVARHFSANGAQPESL